MKTIIDSKEPEPIPMCLYYDPLAPGRCWQYNKKRHGSLKCHEMRKDCPDYTPSTKGQK